MADANHSSSGIAVDNRFAMIPHWVILSPISDGALRLYAVLMKYADNDTGTAFPARSTLARDIRKKSVRSIDGYVKELCDIGALKVTRRRKPGKGNYSNLYTVITANPGGAQNSAPPSATDCAQNYTHSTTPTSVSRPTSSSAPVAPSPQAATAPGDKPAEAQTVPSPLQEIGDETIKNQLLDIAVRASADWQHYLNEDIPADRFEPPESIDVLEQSLNNLYDVTYRIVGDDICNKGWDDRLAKLIAQKPDRPRWGAAVWVNTYINWVRLQG